MIQHARALLLTEPLNIKFATVMLHVLVHTICRLQTLHHNSYQSIQLIPKQKTMGVSGQFPKHEHI